MFRFYTNQLGLRVLGTATGTAFVLIAAYAVVGGHDLDAYTQDRAYGFGLAAGIAGIWAIAVSWLDSDLTGVWCRPPRRRP